MKSFRVPIVATALAAIASLIILRAENNLDSSAPALNNPTPIMTMDVAVTIGFDHPICDNAVNVGESVPVYAGFVTHILGVYQAESDQSLGLLGVGVHAAITNESLVEKIEWRITPFRSVGEQGCTSPALVDQLSPGVPTVATDWTPVSRDLDFSAIVVDYMYKKGAELSARAGDGFKIECRVKGPNGYREAPDPLNFHIVPGPKALHVAIDVDVVGREAGFVANIDKYESWTNQDFVNAFKDYRILTPTGSGKSKEFVVYCFDRFQNPVDAGTGASWRLNGGGMLGVPDAQGRFNTDVLPGDPSGVYETEIGQRGRASIGFTQITYPSCPWSPEFDGHLTSAIEIIVDDKHHEAGVSIVSLDGLPKVARVEGLRLHAGNASWTDPLIDKNETREFAVYAVLRVGDVETPLSDVVVECFSTNGRLAPQDGRVVTGPDGAARIVLTSAGAIVGDLEVVAKLASQSALLSPINARWAVSPATPHVTYERRILAGNRQMSGYIEVDTLSDTGESLRPDGGPEGDGKLKVGVYTSSVLTIHGEPAHEYTVNARSSAGICGDPSVGLITEYSFETLENAVHEVDGAIYQKRSASTDGLHFASLAEANFADKPEDVNVPIHQEMDSLLVSGNLVCEGEHLGGLFAYNNDTPGSGQGYYASAGAGISPQLDIDSSPTGPYQLIWGLSTRDWKLGTGTLIGPSPDGAYQTYYPSGGEQGGLVLPGGYLSPAGGRIAATAINDGSQPGAATIWQTKPGADGMPIATPRQTMPTIDRPVVPHGESRLFSSGQVLFGDPAATAFFGSDDTEMEMSFSVADPMRDASALIDGWQGVSGTKDVSIDGVSFANGPGYDGTPQGLVTVINGMAGLRFRAELKQGYGFQYPAVRIVAKQPGVEGNTIPISASGLIVTPYRPGLVGPLPGTMTLVGGTGTSSRILWSKGSGCQLVLERDSQSAMCRLALHFATSVAGVTQSRVLRGEPFNHFRGAWYSVKVSTFSGRLVLQTRIAASRDEYVPVGSLVVRDQDGRLGGRTDGVVYRLIEGESFQYSGAKVEIPAGVRMLFDSVRFAKYDSSVELGNFIISGLLPGNKLVTDAYGIAHITVSTNGNLPHTQYVPEVLDIEFTGSESFFARLYSTADWFKARMIQAGKAVLMGTEGLGKNASWYEKAAAWASEVIPFASDLRTLAFEVYKGASGCDKVDWLNVGFSAVSLVADCFTLGAAKAITAPMKLATLAAKEFLKSLPLALGANAAIESALTAYNGYVEKLAKETSKQNNQTPEWAVGADSFLEFTQGKIGSPDTEFTDNFFGSMGSANDVIDMADLHKSWNDQSGGDNDFVEFIKLAE